MMPSELLINARPHETRVALVENGVVVELHIERKTGQELMGNIYRGRVVRVLPGMQASFVDIALDRSAFLYVSDVHKDFEEMEQLMLQNSIAEDTLFHQETEESKPSPISGIPFNIEDLLQPGCMMADSNGYRRPHYCPSPFLHKLQSYRQQDIRGDSR